MDGKEIELKLAVPPEALESLKRHPAVKTNQQGRPTAKRLRSVYYDTPDLALSQAGITVRLRVSGKNRVQTVKTSGSRASGLFSRQEWEAPVTGDGLDMAQLRATGLDLLQDKAVTAALAPVFSTEIRRSVHGLGGEDWQVELALDQGEVVAGPKREPVCEVELELLKGPPSRLFALARQMAEAVPARLLTTSKSDRGYDLAAGREPAPVKSKPVPLEPDVGIAEAFRLIARNCLHHLLANEPSLIAHGDAEAVHQMRVALRRLRSALKVFRPLIEGDDLGRIKAEIKWLLALLGPARDAEVFLSEIIAPVIEPHPGDAQLRALHDYWADRRSHDLSAAVAAVAERRFTGLLLDLGAWVEAGDWCADPESRRLNDPVAPFARKVLDKQHRHMDKAAGKKLSKLAPAHLHEVRILGKQLRYAGEFFAPLYGKQAKTFLSTLADLQDVLGKLNDIAMAGPRLTASHHASEQVAGMVTEWHDARRPDLLAAADKAWKELRKHKRFWRG